MIQPRYIKEEIMSYKVYKYKHNVASYFLSCAFQM